MTNQQQRKTLAQWRSRGRKGATLFEYAIIIAIVSIAAIAVLSGIGATTNNKLAPVTTGFN